MGRSLAALAACLLMATAFSPAQEPVKKKRKAASADVTPAPRKKAEPPEEPVAKPKGDDTEASETPPPKPVHAPAASLEPSELKEFDALPAGTQQLLTAALALTKLNLTYTYGSADPASGGMDCSGTIHHLLRAQGWAEVPRDSSSQYVWARQRSSFFAVISKSAESFEFADLRPGDLMFWTGTYATGREIPISHVMLYLGTEKKTGQRVMFGASDGRSYHGVQRWGVSVFDFKMPRIDGANPEQAKVDFVGYAHLPPAGAPAEAEDRKASASQHSQAGEEADEEPKPKATPSKKRKHPKVE